MQSRRLLMISTDRKIFEEGSPVRARQIEYAKDWEEVHIIVFDKVNKHETKNKDYMNEVVIASNCWAYSTKSRLKSLYPFDAIRLGRFIIQRRKITNITCQDPFLTAMASASLKNKFDLFFEIQIHTDIGSSNFGHTISNKIRKTMALLYLPKADQIRVVSNRIRDYLIRSLSIEASKAIVKPIAVDVEKIKNAPILADADLHKKYPQFEKIVLMASRLEKEKNVGLAIRAWTEVVKRVPKAGLIIVGNGSQIKELKALSSRSGFGQGSEFNSSNSSIMFEDWADQPTLISYYKTADLFLNTSLFEGYGMTLVEAHASGCKIISTDVGVAREVGARIVGWSEKEVANKIIDIFQ